MIGADPGKVESAVPVQSISLIREDRHDENFLVESTEIRTSSSIPTMTRFLNVSEEINE